MVKYLFSVMNYRNIFKDFHRAFRSDPFWPFAYFSWLYSYWSGTSVIYGMIFSSITMVVLSASSILMTTKYLSNFKELAQTEVFFVIHQFNTAINIAIVPLLVTIWMIRGHRRIHHVISSIAIIDEKLSKFGECPSSKSTWWKLLLLTFSPLVIIVFACGGMGHNFDNFNSRITISMWLFHSVYHEVVRFYTQGLFTCLALVLGDRYRAVNSVLKKVSQEYDYDFKNAWQLNHDWVVAIRELRAIHRKLFFAAENISEAFGIQLLIILIVSLFTVIGDLYKLYLTKTLPCYFSLLNEAEYIFWCLIHVVPLCIAAFCCSWTSTQEKQTPVLLQEITVCDEDLRMEISTFSLQLIHYDLYFSACGFFKIDLTFIQVIFGTIATYLVILIQLGTVPNDCRNSSFQAPENISTSSQ